MAKYKKKTANKAEQRPSRTLSINVTYGEDGINIVSVVADGDTWAHSKLRAPLNKLAATMAALLADAGEPGTLVELLQADFEMPKMAPQQAKMLVRSFLSQVDVNEPETTNEACAPGTPPETEPETTSKS